jgi:lipopolysaccharide transport system ATP-binding protein
VVGIIGPNGAGKSTLLKILSRITEPTDGYAEIHGRVGSLLEVGTGFHPELTGRENIYLNGAILGMKRSEIAQKFDEIVAFSGVQKFINTPLKRYSSGMYVRLAFAVAAHLDPEILLVDEVLAVGDAAFQEKCLGKMDEIASAGRTVLFVSHNMAAVRKLCSRGLLLEDGRVKFHGNVDETIQVYLDNVDRTDEGKRVTLADRRDRSGSGRIRVVSVEARSLEGEGSKIKTGSAAEFIVGYRASENCPVTRLHVSISVADSQGANLFVCTTGMYYCDFRNVAPSGQVVCRIKYLPLIPGRYWVSIILKDDQGVADWINKASEFDVTDDGGSGILLVPSRRWGSVVLPHEWGWLPLDQQRTLDGSIR